jgi:hypothetical protein
LRELNYNLQKSGLDNYAIRALKYCPVQPWTYTVLMCQFKNRF